MRIVFMGSADVSAAVLRALTDEPEMESSGS